MKIQMNFSKTINLGNYENMKLEAGCEKEIAPNKNVKEAYDELYVMLEKEVEERLEKKRIKNGKYLGQR
jgi:uncharacterized protein Veg